MLVPVEKVPPTLLGSPAKSKRTRMFLIGALFAPTNKARTSTRLPVGLVASLGATTLGSALTDADSTVVVTGGTDEVEDGWITTVCVLLTPPEVATMSSGPVVEGAV